MRKFSELSIMERKYTFNDKPLRRPIDKFLNKAYRIDDEKRVKSRYIYLVEEMTWLSNRDKEFNDMIEAADVLKEKLPDKETFAVSFRK